VINLSHYINLFAGVVGALITWAFGGWSGLLELFFIFIVLDYITGVSASFKEGQGLSSEVGLWGLLTKALMIAAVLVGHRADLAFNTDFIMMGIVYAFLANELISISENYARLGLPLSDHLKPLLAILKNNQTKFKSDL
jgi:toxin secretion/phage lysis holin